jgi:toxin ParE1/3/4
MSRYRLAPSARIDLDGIWDYIARQAQSPVPADRLTDLLHEKFRALAEQPGMGSEWEPVGRGVLHFTVKNHTIFYRQTDFGVEIIRVARGGLDLDDFDLT